MSGCKIAGHYESICGVEPEVAYRGGLVRDFARVNSMKRYSVRPATFADIDAVCSLIEKQNIADYGEAMVTTNDVAKSWQSMDLDHMTCLAYAEGKLAGYGELRDGHSPFIYLAHPSDLDLGFQLLTILEAKALRQKVEKIEFFTRISEKNQTLLKLFASYGYRTNLSFFIMELELLKVLRAHRGPKEYVFGPLSLTRMKRQPISLMKKHLKTRDIISRWILMPGQSA